MLLEIGVVDNPKHVGYWSGLVESTYAICQLLTGACLSPFAAPGTDRPAVFPATWVADSYGRKPVVVWSAVIIAISMGSFGVSTTYLHMILSRILGGVVGGSKTCIRVMASEMSTKETESQIFTMIGVAYRTGQILGQPSGGSLSHPERHFPALFDHPFWRAYPYALPCFVGAAYALVCAILGQIILKETLGREMDTKTAIPSTPGIDCDERTLLLSSAASVSSTPTQVASPKPTVLSLLHWPLASLLISVFAMILITEVFFATYPLFAFTSVEHGGLGLSEAQIGFHMSMRSLLALATMLPFSALTKRFGKLNVYRFSIFAWIPTILLFPFLNRIARAGGKDGVLWYVVLFTLWTVWSATGWGWSKLFFFFTCQLGPNNRFCSCRFPDLLGSLPVP
jgi:MFS family permease